jgi:hypothetical protein
MVSWALAIAPALAAKKIRVIYQRPWLRLMPRKKQGPGYDTERSLGDRRRLDARIGRGDVAKVWQVPYHSTGGCLTSLKEGNQFWLDARHQRTASIDIP